MAVLDRRTLLAGAGAELASPGPAVAADRSVRAPVTVRRNQPLVALELNGRGPYSFLLDTGADGFGITAEAAGRAGLPHGSRADITGVSGGVVEVPTWYARSVRLGGALDLGLATFVEAPGGGLDGCMAGNALIAQPAAFALTDGEVRLFLRGRPDLTGYARLPTAFDVRRSGLAASRNSLDPHMLVTAALDGRPLRLAIDTGAQAAVVLLPDASRPLWDRTPAQEVMVEGATGRSRGRLIRTGPLQLGALIVPQVLVNLSDPAERHVDDAFDGLIGVDLLRQLEFVVDANAGVTWLKRGAAFLAGGRNARIAVEHERHRASDFCIREGAGFARLSV